MYNFIALIIDKNTKRDKKSQKKHIECETWCLILEIINIICSTHVLRSRLIDGDAYIQCKVSLVVSGVMVDASDWAMPLNTC